MDSGGTVDVSSFLKNKFVLLSEGKYLYILFEAFRREAKLSFLFTKYYHCLICIIIILSYIP